MNHRKPSPRPEGRRHPLNERVERLLSAWQDKRQQLQDHSRALEAALRAFARGEAPEPLQQKQEVEALRRECDALFNDVLGAVREAQDAGVHRK